MIEARHHLEQGELGRSWRRATRRIRAIEPRRHCELAVYHVISGQMRYLIDDKVCVAGPRTLLWVTPAHAHMLLSETPDFDMWIFVFAAELEPEAAARPRLVSRLSTEDHNELCAIAQASAETASVQTKLRGIAWWGERALAAVSAASSSDVARCRPIVRRTAELIAADPALDGHDLAGIVGVGVSRIGRLFRQDTGESLVDYRNRCRLAAVDRLLAEQRGANLLSAALDAGFGSYSQFFRVFQMLRRQSPREWYRQLEG